MDYIALFLGKCYIINRLFAGRRTVLNKTKRKIFQIAIKLFSEKGYDNTSIEEITAVAGVAKGSLYYHFSKKEDIFDLLLEEGMNLLRNSIEIKTKNCKTALDKIKAVILIQIKVSVLYEDLLNVVFSEMWGKESKNIKCQNAVNEYINLIKDIIKDGISRGEFYDGDVDALAAGVFGVAYSSLIYRIRQKEKIDIDKVYNGFIDTIVRGISKK